MLTKEETDFPRIRNRGLALFILKSVFLFRTLFFISGLQKAWEKWKTNEPIKFPRFRTKVILSFFLRNPGEMDSMNKPLVTKGDFLKAVDKIYFNLRESKSPLLGKFLLHIRESFSNLSFSKTEYFIRFLIDTAKNEIKREFLEKKLTAITLDLTNKCNRNCVHCFASSDTESETEIVDYNILRDSLIEAREKLGCRFLNILGGEPFLSQDKIIRLLADFPYMPIQVFTNGTLINQESVHALKGYPNIAVLVSIEGDAGITDALRGAESFRIAEKAFQILEKNSLIYGASITANKENFIYVSSEEFAQLLSDLGCFYTWIFDYKPIGRATHTNLQLSDEEKKIFNERIRYLNRNYPLLFINTEKDPEVVGGCPATKGTILHIAANGRVVPCIAVRYSNRDINIKSLTIREIMSSDMFRDYREIGSSRGCAQKYFPKELNEWIMKHDLGPLYD